MIAVDSSVAIAAFGEWHELNERAAAVVAEGVGLPAHARLETFSVLTGFPPPHRAAPALVLEWLEDRFPTILPSPSPDEQHELLLRRLTAAGRIGGAVYDGLVALTALSAGATLLTADSRAATTYDLIGVDHRYLVEAPS